MSGHVTIATVRAENEKIHHPPAILGMMLLKFPDLTFSLILTIDTEIHCIGINKMG